jgi:hypothetical protein
VKNIRRLPASAPRARSIARTLFLFLHGAHGRVDGVTRVQKLEDDVASDEAHCHR